MAIQLNISISGLIGDLTIGIAPFSKSLEVVGNNAIANVQNIGTSEEVVTTGDVSFPCGLLYVSNQSLTETLTISLDSGGSDVIANIEPGGPPYIGYGLAAAPYAAFTDAAATALVICADK